METKTRSLLKAISYRVFASIVTAVLIFSFTGKLLLAVGLGLLDSVVKIVVFFLHERVWMAISFGRIRHPLDEIQIRKPIATRALRTEEIAASFQIGARDDQELSARGCARRVVPKSG